jgi:3-hydroxyacyl-CoA dehydrogenase
MTNEPDTAERTPEQIMARAIWEIGAADHINKDDANMYTDHTLAALKEAGFVIEAAAEIERLRDANQGLVEAIRKIADTILAANDKYGKQP